MSARKDTAGGTGSVEGLAARLALGRPARRRPSALSAARREWARCPPTARNGRAMPGWWMGASRRWPFLVGALTSASASEGVAEGIVRPRALPAAGGRSFLVHIGRMPREKAEAYMK